jgi:hypothetical protein
MTTLPVRVERRVGQRFPYLLPVSLRQSMTSAEGVGFTQDLSSRGVFFFCDIPLIEGAVIELTLRMPSEITLGESMPVRCTGRVLRVIRPLVESSLAGVSSGAETKIGVAARLEQYEYLPEHDQSFANLSRVSSLHSHADEDRATVNATASRSVG